LFNPADRLSTNYFDCLRDDSANLSDRGEGVLKPQSPGVPSNPDLVIHNPNGSKRIHAESPSGEPTISTSTHKFT
jgi:hypothetical protein